MLRITIGLELIRECAFYLFAPSLQPVAAWLIGLAGIAVAISILIGFLTPVAGGVVAVGGVAMVISQLPSMVCDSNAAKILVLNLVTMGLAAGFLGPGAFSVDAHLFGRREIIIPEPSRRPTD